MFFLRKFMRRIFIFVMGLLGLGLLGYTCVDNKADIIQYQLSKKIQLQLSDKRFKYVALHIDGRNVLLKGKVASDAVKQQAEYLAKTDGIYSLDNQIKVVNSLTK
jgi:hypothetical protein